MRRLGRTLLDLVEVHLPALFLVLLSSSIVLQVILRYVFHSPSPALFELAGYSFIWVIFLGAPLARRYRSHIRFDIIYQWLPRKVQLIVDLILDLFFTVALAIMFVPVLEELQFLRFIRSEVLRIPWTYLLLCFPLFILLMLIENSRWIVRELRELKTGERVEVEEPPWR